MSLYPIPCVLKDGLCLSKDFHSLTLPFKTFLDHCSLTVETSMSLMPTFLLFLPRYVRSSISFANENGERTAAPAILLKVLVEFIGPLADDFTATDVALTTALLRVVLELDTVATTRTTDSRYSAHAMIAQIACANPVAIPSIVYCDMTPDLEVDIELKRCSRVLAAKVPENHPDPYVRKLRWYLLARTVIRSSRTEIREHLMFHSGSPEKVTVEEGYAVGPQSKPSFTWLVASPFSDDDHCFREEISRQLRNLVLSQNESLLLSHFCSDEDYIVLKSKSKNDALSSQQSYEFEHATENVVSEFFRAVDIMLHTSIGVSDSQLSFTLANSVESSGKVQRNLPNKLSLERTAIGLLASFCTRIVPGKFVDNLFFEKAFQRLTRIWAAATPLRADDLSVSSRALAFAQLSHVTTLEVTEGNIWWEKSPQFAATVVSDIMVLNSNTSREIQFSQLENFIRISTAKDRSESIVTCRILKSSCDFMEAALPAMIAQFVEDKSLELIRLVPAFRQFLEEKTRRMKKQRIRDPVAVGGSNAPVMRKYGSTQSTLEELDKQIARFFRDNHVVDRVLPLLFMRMDRSGLLFFTKEVLRGTTLHSLMKNRDRMILKGLVWELGREPEEIGPARIAIRTAAVARNLDKTASMADKDPQQSTDTEVELGKLWVTSHFMYLLVSVVQFRWKMRSLSDRLHAVRCLHGLLDFLIAREAPQYFPQVIATINVAILDGDKGSLSCDQVIRDAALLRLYAVKALSKCIRLVAGVQIDTISQSLTTIVVALIPIIDDQRDENVPQNAWDEARNVAVSIFEFLTAGAVGRSLADDFREVPFLPVSQSLENVHRSLRSYGVDFDNLVVLSGTTPLAATASKGCSNADISATMGSTVTVDSEKMPALQKRLGLICGLLDNESMNVRKVALQHLTDLLRANRETYFGLIHHEGSMYAKRFLTVEFKDESGNRTCKSSLFFLCEDQSFSHRFSLQGLRVEQ